MRFKCSYIWHCDFWHTDWFSIITIFSFTTNVLKIKLKTKKIVHRTTTVVKTNRYHR